MHEHKADESDLYMDMAGIDLPIPSSADDSALLHNDASFDSGRGSALRVEGRRLNTKSSPIKKVNLASGRVIETIADIHRSKSPDYKNVGAFGNLAALKDTIEEQKAALGILKDKLLDVNCHKHRIGPQGNPLPIVSSYPRGAQRLSSDEDEDSEGEGGRCPLHDHHEPGCPVRGFMDPLQQEGHPPPSPTKSPTKEEHHITVSVMS